MRRFLRSDRFQAVPICRSFVLKRNTLSNAGRVSLPALEPLYLKEPHITARKNSRA